MEIRALPYDFDLDALNGYELWGADLLELRKREQPRSTLTLHVSDIIRDLANRVIVPGQRTSVASLSAPERSQMGAYCEVGFSWEIAVQMAVRLRLLHRRQLEALDSGGLYDVARQGEVIVDGIAMTPDAARNRVGRIHDDFDFEIEAVEEYKATWKSAGKLNSAQGFEADFWEWCRQSQSYARALGTTRVDFFVLWINGDYKPPKPRGMKYEVTYSAMELEQNWNLLLRHRDRMMAEGWQATGVRQ